jgi:sigma-54 dependent transcriptional regulator, acetoin dehydrogenase operon transcriptional activator AcoR
MMSSDLRAQSIRPRLGFDFAEVDPQETSKAWNRFLANRHAPSLPLTGVRSVIYQSWIRSNTTGVKPEQFAAPSLERNTPISKSTYDHAELRRATRASLTQIGDLLSGAEAMLILTDANGVILETVGDNSTLTKASKINLSVGGLWSEHDAGTNGIGTALWAGEPVYVHGEEHFCEGMKAWSCAAAPIRDPIDRGIIGVINLSGLTRIFQKHNAAFAATVARDIEVALEHEQALLNMRLMEAIVGMSPTRNSEPADGLAIVDRFGRLIYNRNSGLEAGRSDRDLGLGTRFLDLRDGLTEERILASLPAEHGCQDIRLINIDGEVKGAALVFKPAHSSLPRSVPRQVQSVPGVHIHGTDLKIVGKSDAILEALDVANRIASVNTPTLIEGQTGVGKELFARLIHSQMKPASTHPFNAINCGAITPQMFGEGLLLPLEGGLSAPLCLDEIGELPPDVQPFLLRVLEERLTGLHGPDQTEPSVRVISLTNRVLLDEVEAGRFRRDLFYRLSTIILKIPPLRDRGEDILLIAEHYNRKIHTETGRDLLVLGSDVQDALMAHSWPGNVRELRNVVSGLHYLAKSRHVTLADLPREIAHPDLSKGAQFDANSAQDLRLARALSLKHAEVMLIENSLAHHNWNISKAALALGISRPTLYRKIQTLGIHEAGGEGTSKFDTT